MTDPDTAFAVAQDDGVRTGLSVAEVGDAYA